MKANCPECKVELLRLTVKTSKGPQDRWLHPYNPLVDCKYRQDGVQVTTELIDEFLNDKFQELVEGNNKLSLISKIKRYFGGKKNEKG